MEQKTIGHADLWQGDVVQTNGTATLLAEEMHMLIIIKFLVMAQAQFVLHAAVAALNGMYQVLFLEECQGTEDAGLVEGKDGILQVFHGHWALCIMERLGDDDSIGGGFDAVGFEQLYILVCCHVLLFLFAKVVILSEK